MGFSITFASDSEDYLSNEQNVLKERGMFVLQGCQATQHHLASEGGKYHFVLLSRPETAFHYLPYARAYALYSKIIYDMVDLHWLRFEREMEISGDGNLLSVIEHFRRIELLNSTCADLVLAITDEEKERLLVEQPNTNGSRPIYMRRIPQKPPLTNVGDSSLLGVFGTNQTKMRLFSS